MVTGLIWQAEKRSETNEAVRPMGDSNARLDDVKNSGSVDEFGVVEHVLAE